MTKPSFAAPSQTLEKSLKEHIAAKRPPSSSSPPAAAGGGKSTGARPKKPGGSKRLSRESAKEPSPPTQPQQPDPKGLPITDEEKEKRLQRDAGGGGGVATEAAVEAVEVAPSAAEGEPSPSINPSAGGASSSSSRLLRQPTVDLLASEVARASLRPPEQRPFFDAVFQALDCADSDYVALFALCLFYAIQQNAGKFSSRGLWKSFLFGKLACARWRRGKIPFFLLCGVPIRGRFSCKFFRLLIL